MCAELLDRGRDHGVSHTIGAFPRASPSPATSARYALVGAVTIAFSSILVRLSHASPSTAAIFRCVYALPILGLLAWIEDRRFGARTWRRAPRGAARRHLLQRRPAALAPLDRRRRRRAGHRAGQHPGGAPAAGGVGAAVRAAGAAGAARAARSRSWACCSSPGCWSTARSGANPTRGALFGVGAGVAYVGFLLLLRRGGADLRRPAGPAVRRHRGGRGAVRGRRTGHRRRPAGPELAGRGVADHARAQLPGHGLAASSPRRCRGCRPR